MNKNLPRIFLCVDQGMIWECVGDIPVQLIIKNVDKNWIRRLEVKESKRVVDEEEELLLLLEEGGVEQPGLREEQKNRMKEQESPLLKLNGKKVLDKNKN